MGGRPKNSRFFNLGESLQEDYILNHPEGSSCTLNIVSYISTSPEELELLSDNSVVLDCKILPLEGKAKVYSSVGVCTY